VIVYLVYRCLKEHGLPSINIKTTGAPGEAELTSLLPDSTIRGATIESFLNEITREKHIRFTSQQLNGYTQHMSADLGARGFSVVYKGMLDIMGLTHLFNIFIKLYGPYMCINGFYTIWEFNREAALLKYLIID
jgi:hypothetical protein